MSSHELFYAKTSGPRLREMSFWFHGFLGLRHLTQLHHHLADVPPLEEAEERAHRLVDSFHDRFLVLHLASFEIAPHFLLKLGLAVQPVKNHQPLHGQPLGCDVE